MFNAKSKKNMLIEYCIKRRGAIGIDIHCNGCPFKPIPYGHCEDYRMMNDKYITNKTTQQL